MQSFVAWFIFPAVFLGISFGLGALLRSLTGLELPDGLLVPLGAAAGCALALTGYVIGLGELVTPAAVVVLALAGLALATRERRLPRPGLLALVWLLAYGLYIAPVVLTGHWTWTGYNFVNDTSVQLLLAEWLPEHGRALPPEPFVSTNLDILRSYLSGGYPLGSHALLAAMGAVVPVPLEAVYQPFIAAWAGVAAMSLAVLVQRLAGPRWAAFAAFAAVASNLVYQYALQGNMKEIVTVGLLATMAAVAGWTLAALRDRDPAARGTILTSSAAVLAVPVAATLGVLSTAGAPYAALIVLLWLGALLVLRRVPSPKALALALGAGAAVLLAASATTWSKLIAFGEATSTTYASEARATDLGHLARPLELRQTAGVWLLGDYRLPPAGVDATLTAIGVWLILALALLALGWSLRRRQLHVLLFCVPVVLIMALVTPRVSPYADAKTFMFMAPAITLLGALGAAAAGRLKTWLGWALGAALLAAVLASNALAYHSVQLAPTDRMAALRDLDRRFEGQGLILFNEPEEFAKNFMSSTKVNVGAEAVTPKQTQLRIPQQFSYLYFDLDDQTLEYVSAFPLIALRRSPAASRPPAPYRRVYANEYYEVWRRGSGPRVLEHLPLQAVNRASLEPRCADVTAMARRARRGQLLVAAAAPEVVQLDTLNTDTRSPQWPPHPYRAGMVAMGGPGEAETTATFAGGRYKAWIAGSFGRAITAYLDGKRVGAAKGVENIGQWHEIGTVDVEAGRHRLRMVRPGGNLAPGDGFAGALGPLAFERVEPQRLVEVSPGDARGRLCGRDWDWIERVAR